MDLVKVVMLGTSAAIPTKERGLPSIAIVRRRSILLFDVGEGTQYKMLLFGLSPLRVKTIFITHAHGDHMFGLPGLLQTMSMYGRVKPLYIYAPRNVIEYVKMTFEMVRHDPQYEVHMAPLSDGLNCKIEDLTVTAFPVEHVGESYGFKIVQDDKPGKFNVKKAIELGIPRGPLWKRLQLGEDIVLPSGKIVKSSEVVGPPRPGIKVVYTGDTKPCERVVKEAEGVDLLIHDATFDSSLEDVAHEQGHSTAKDAAIIASEAGVVTLVLTHISARYRDSQTLIQDARKYFERAIVAEDGLTIYLT